METQHALGAEVAWSRSDSWLWAGAFRRRHGTRSLYVPYGPTISGDTPGAVADLLGTGRSARLDFVRFEPRGAIGVAELVGAGALVAPPIQPQYTIVIDLDQDESRLRHGLAQRHRRRVNGADRQGLSFRRSGDPADVSYLVDLIHRTAAHNHFRPHPDAYYRTLARVLLPRGAGSLFLAEAHGEVVAVVMGFDFGDTRYYAHVAADPEAGRRLGAAAPLVWYMMLDAKAEGRRRFDLWGIAPTDDPAHPWAGFTAFKRGFGGEMVSTAGTWELPIARLRYGAFRLARGLLG